MGEYAEMMLDGTCCSSCGDYLGQDTGYPIMCSACEPANIPKRKRKSIVGCPFCQKQLGSRSAAFDHIKAIHTPKEPGHE